MTSAETLGESLSTVEANEDFTEAVLRLSDKSRLCFCHRVGERWAKAMGPRQDEHDAGQAGELRATITRFRLNAEHLDVEFEDGSRWDESLQDFVV